jgi:hypothetical protein
VFFPQDKGLSFTPLQTTGEFIVLFSLDSYNSPENYFGRHHLNLIVVEVGLLFFGEGGSTFIFVVVK